MKNKIGVVLLLIIVLIYEALSYLSIINMSVTLDIVMLMILVCSIILLFIDMKEDTPNNVKIKNKLFNSLVEKSNTIYLVINNKNKKTIYLSKHIEDILGIKYNKDLNDLTYKILNIPVIKTQLSNWDNKSEYISSMMEYDNPKYKQPIWLKIIINNYKTKNEDLIILQIIDSTKEHDHQHLLISQASDIKSRETTLNEIIEKTYDLEININVINDTYDLKYYKKDILYFGEESHGNYTNGLKKILEYVNESDREIVNSNLNLDTLKEHFNKYELDSKIIRYRVGNEIKGNAWLESTIFFLTNKGRNKISILTKNVTNDAESIREQNILLQNALMEAKKINKTKTELISTISHDIRTPLTNIKGLSDDLLTKDIDKNIKEDIKDINDSSKEILVTIDDLLDTTKIEKKTIKQEENKYSIYDMFKKIEESVSEYIDKSIKFSINLDSNLPVILYGNYKRITSAITELINNSIKNTTEGKIEVNVKGEKINNNIKLIVEVLDTGNGMSDTKLNKVINSNKISGLTSVKELMNALDGTLEFESKEGEYTKATITFIQKIIEDNKVRTLIENNKNAETFDLTGKKVLVVDDNQLNLKVTNKFLKPYNVEVTLVESGIECIEKVKEQTFDLILMDQMMPGLSGVATMNKLKEIDNFNTPIVVLTADAMNGQKEKYLENGFDDYVSKPIDKKELSRVLNKFLK